MGLTLGPGTRPPGCPGAARGPGRDAAGGIRRPPGGPGGPRRRPGPLSGAGAGIRPRAHPRSRASRAPAGAHSHETSSSRPRAVLDWRSMVQTPPVRFLPRPTLKRLGSTAPGVRVIDTVDAGRAARKALYRSQEWYRARKSFLRDHPTCVAEGCTAPATVVDHSEGHSSPDWQEKFWDRSLWQGMCRDCHNLKTNREIERHTPGRSMRKMMPFS
jgi:hypothetical protein